VPPVTHQPPPVRLVRWTGNRVEVEQAIVGTTIKVLFADEHCIVMKPNGGRPDVNIAKQGEWIVLSAGPSYGSVLTSDQIRERWPGAIP
jgi:hypothetical protein